MPMHLASEVQNKNPHSSILQQWAPRIQASKQSVWLWEVRLRGKSPAPANGRRMIFPIFGEVRNRTHIFSFPILSTFCALSHTLFLNCLPLFFCVFLTTFRFESNWKNYFWRQLNEKKSIKFPTIKETFSSWFGTGWWNSKKLRKYCWFLNKFNFAKPACM